MENFLFVFAAVFPIVNPPGSALIFLGLTRGASNDMRRRLAFRIAVNAFFVLSGSLILGALILKFYGISVPVMRVAGGFIVAVAGWKLLNQEPADRQACVPADRGNTDFMGQAFYPLTLPMTTGPGSIAVMISLAMTQTVGAGAVEEMRFLIASLLAIILTTAIIYVCFAWADRVQVLLGQGGTDIALRISAFILFCLGVQILWTGLSDLLRTI